MNGLRDGADGTLGLVLLLLLDGFNSDVLSFLPLNRSTLKRIEKKKIEKNDLNYLKLNNYLAFVDFWTLETERIFGICLTFHVVRLG